MSLEKYYKNKSDSEFFQLIRNNLNKPWDWHILSGNIPVDIVLDNPDKPWDWKWFSFFNPNITWEIVKNNLDKHWDWESL
jgi:hypothetical protein